MRTFWMIWVLAIILHGTALAQSEQAIDKYRDSVYAQLRMGEAKNVNVRLETLAYTKDVKNKSTIFFLTLDEIETIYLLQNNFSGVLTIITNYDFEYDKRRYRYAVPKTDTNSLVMINGVQRSTFIYPDSLWTFQGKLLMKHEVQILETINKTQYDNETKAFLTLFLRYKIGYHVDIASEEYYSTKGDDREALNDAHNELNLVARKEGREFIRNYPNSKFRPFVERFITKEYELENFAIGLEFLFGSMLPTGNFSTYAHPSFCTFLGPKLYYKRTFVNVNGGVGLNANKQEFFHDTLWDGIGTLTLSIELGRAIDLGRRFSISPLIGMRKLWNIHSGSNGFRSSSLLTYGVELNFGKNGTKEPYNSFSPLIFSGRERSGYHLRVLYQNPGYDQTIHELKGGILTIAVGGNMTFFGRKYDRK